MSDGQVAWILYGAALATIAGAWYLLGLIPVVRSLKALRASRRARRRPPYDWAADPTFRQPGHVRVLP